MASKKKLQLEQRVGNISDGNPGQHVWLVTRVTNSTTPRIGETLDRVAVSNYCEREDWEVQIS